MINLYGSRVGTQFTFDKIYANRHEMDTACENDGVFIGRYVLISYEQKSNSLSAETTVVNNLSYNLSIDIQNYYSDSTQWNGIGWDNTVWQKQFIEGAYIYIKIADLNSYNFNTIDCGSSIFTNQYLRYNQNFDYNFPNDDQELCRIIISFVVNGETLKNETFFGIKNQKYKNILNAYQTINGKLYRFYNLSSSSGGILINKYDDNAKLIITETPEGRLLTENTGFTAHGEEVIQ